MGCTQSDHAHPYLAGPEGSIYELLRRKRREFKREGWFSVTHEELKKAVGYPPNGKHLETAVTAFESDLPSNMRQTDLKGGFVLDWRTPTHDSLVSSPEREQIPLDRE